MGITEKNKKSKTKLLKPREQWNTTTKSHNKSPSKTSTCTRHPTCTRNIRTTARQWSTASRSSRSGGFRPHQSKSADLAACPPVQMKNFLLSNLNDGNDDGSVTATPRPAAGFAGCKKC